MKKNTKGFTLIELLVVIAIIGLLSTLTIVSLNTARARARDAKRVSDVKQMQTALEMYFNDASAYPASVTSTGAIANGSSTYLTVVPTAPTPVDGTCSAGNNTYTYTNTTAGTSYTYTLSYCLGATTSGIAAGIQTATPAGIK